MNIARRHPSALPAYLPRAFEDQFGKVVENMFEDFLAPFAHGGALAPWSAGAVGPADTRIAIQ